MRTLARLGCGAVLIVALAASDEAALIGNYGLARRCPAGGTPSRLLKSTVAPIASVLQTASSDRDYFDGGDASAHPACGHKQGVTA